MTSNDASAAMPSTATATSATAALPTANVTVTSRPNDPSGYRPEFRALDIDQDGLLSRAEARKSEKLKEFSSLDTDHDGKLSRTETDSVVN
jgi:Ca2+-binding EF-hand superfamily protein